MEVREGCRNWHLFAEKLIQYTHEKVGHLGVAGTMAVLREKWHILHMRALVKRHVCNCNICKLFYMSAPLPTFRTEACQPFQYTGCDFAGPIIYRKNKEEFKAYILIFTCAAMRVVHLEVTKSQLADEFISKLNAFITRRTRPETIISDNGGAFKATSDWIRKLRKSEKLQDYLALQEINWRFNLSRSPWWGAMESPL